MAGEGGQIKEEGQTICTTELMTKEKEDMMKKELFTMAMNGQWDQIVEAYTREARAHVMRITKAGDTALHIAISQGNEQKVKDLVQQITNPQVRSKVKEALEIKNDRGNTPLHIAASKGNVSMCKCIANVHQQSVGVPNGDGETPFFLSVLHGKREAFFCLHDICGVENGYKYSRRKDGDTILHCAIARDYFDLAFQITHSYQNLVNYKNEQGFTPLHVLASKPSAFRSGSLLRGYNRIIYHCIFVDNLQVETSSHHQTKGTKGPVDKKDLDVPENYRTCTNFFKLFWDIIKAVTFQLRWNGEQTDAENPEGHPGHQLVPANYRTCFEFAKLASLGMLISLGFGFNTIRKIEQKKQKHKWAVQVLHALLTRTSAYEYHAGAEPKQEIISKQEGDTLPYAVMSGCVTLHNVTELPTTSNGN
ncbi:hypothetical protein F2P56_024607 [Juglans regia]|uniref:Uncharacterized protein n=1 Tax=Juglans regia TaxID=51240 RepID=A0A833UC34_JUGRE|nr:hypothetical protein F2P56_024607 [Juglans regia]